jgi:hypothetical protein
MKKTHVTLTTNNGARSIHIFEKQTEASNFINWIRNYNSSDLNIEVKQQESNNDEKINDINECSTFI